MLEYIIFEEDGALKRIPVSVMEKLR